MLVVRAKLEVRDLTVALPTTNGWVRPVAQVSFTLNEGESLGIVGESGSGKTMLSLALMGLSPPGARASGEATLRTSTNGSSDGSSEHTIDLLKASPVEPGKFCAGSVPALDALPPGCVFSPRCPRREPECDTRVPELRSVDEQHQTRCILVP